jgi:hypothetical protein
MKVKEFIEELQKLDQEKEININCEGAYFDIDSIVYDEESGIYII